MPINVQSWTIDRGRSYELDKNSPGTATVNMIDTTGELDPTSAAYAFDPMTPAAISLLNPVTSTNHTVFRGHVARLTYDVHPTQDYAYATLELVDGMDFLAQVEMLPQDFGDSAFYSTNPGNVVYPADATGQAASTRINFLLDEANWPVGQREIFSGNIKLKETIYPPRQSILAAIQDVADAEFPGVANFYVQKDGRATFHGRLARFNPADVQYHISTWRCGDIAAVNADSTRAKIFELSYDGGDKDKIINSVLATPQEITDAQYLNQWVANSSSIATYGRRGISFENLLTDGDHFGATTDLVAVKKFGTYYVDNYKDPKTRVNRVTFKTLDPGDSNAGRVWAILCGVDISDLIRLTVTHPQGGFSDTDFYVEGLHYEVVPSGKTTYDRVTLTLDVSPRDHYLSNPLD